MNIYEKAYLPKSDWGKAKYKLQKKLVLSFSYLVRILLNRYPSIIGKVIDKNYFKKDPVSISSDILSLHSCTFFLMIPTEEISTFKKGLKNIYFECFSLQGFSQDIDDALENATKYNSGWSSLGYYKIKSDQCLTSSFQVKIHYIFDSYILISICCLPSEKFQKAWSMILSFNHHTRTTLYSSDKYMRFWGAFYESNWKIKAEDIDDLLLDLKWEIVSLFTKACNKKCWLNDLPPSIDVYLKLSDELDKSKFFLEELGIPLHLSDLSCFDKDDNNLNYQFFYGSVNGLKEDCTLRVLADKKMINVAIQHGYSLNTSILYQLKIFVENSGPLLIIHALITDIEDELSSLSKLVFKGINTKQNIFKISKRLNDFFITANRLHHEYKISLRTKCIEKISSIQSNDKYKIELFSEINKNIKQSFGKIISNVELQNKSIQRIIDYQIITSNKNMQKWNFIVALIAATAAILALIPEANRVLFTSYLNKLLQ